MGGVGRSTIHPEVKIGRRQDSDSASQSNQAVTGAGEMAPTGPAAPDSKLRIGLGCLLLLFLAGAFLPGPGAWGFNHLAYLPRWMTPVWGLLALAVAWPRFQRMAVRALASPIPKFLFHSWFGPLVTVVAAGAAFGLLREESFFMGDGYLVGELVERGVPFRAFDNLDYMLHFQVYKKLHLLHPKLTSFDLYRIGSVLAGVIGVALVLYLLRRTSWEPWRKSAALGLFLFSGPVVLFCGYVESYSYLYVFVTAFLLASLLFLERRCPLWVASAFFGLALSFHLTALFSAPALLFLALRGGVTPAWKRWLQAAGPPALLLVVSAVIHLTAGYDAVWFRREFLESKNTRSILIPLGESRGLLTLYHWKDLANLALIIAPACLCTVLVRARTLWIQRKEAPVLFLLAQMGGVALCSLILDRKLGGARDWDLLAAHSGGLLFLAARLLPGLDPARKRAEEIRDPAAIEGGRGMRSSRSRRTESGRVEVPHPSRAAGTALGVSFLATAPWVLLLHLEPRSITRFVDVAGDFPNFARAYAYEEVGKYYRKAEDYQKAEEMYERTVSTFPGNARFRVLLGSVYFMRENLVAAESEYKEALAIDPQNKLAKEMLAKLYLRQEKFGPATDYFAEAVAAKPNSPDLWQGYGAAALKARRFDEAVRAYQRLLQLNRNLRVRHELGTSLFALGRYAEAATVFREALALGETSTATRLGLALSLVSSLQEELRSGKSPSPDLLSEIEVQLGLLQSAQPVPPEAGDLRRRFEILRRGGLPSEDLRVTPLRAPGTGDSP